MQGTRLMIIKTLNTEQPLQFNGELKCKAVDAAFGIVQPNYKVEIRLSNSAVKLCSRYMDDTEIYWHSIRDHRERLQ